MLDEPRESSDEVVVRNSEEDESLEVICAHFFISVESTF